MNWTCSHCKNVYENFNSSQKANHSRWCDNNPKVNSYKTKLEETREKRKAVPYENQYVKAKKRGEHIESPLKGKKRPDLSFRHTEETKKKLSYSRKLWLKNNPEKHPWKKNDNFTSAPCEYLKNKLREKNIGFTEEYMPIEGRYFSIDIAFTERKIGIEINGNQHYNKDYTLKYYYQKRHELIEKHGWQLIELHYSKAYNEEILINIINMVS